MPILMENDDAYKMSVLMYAIYDDALEMMDQLLAHKYIEINATDIYGQTALHHAWNSSM